MFKPTCKCIENALGMEAEIIIGKYSNTREITAWFHYKNKINKIKLEGAILEHKFCPQCGAPYKEIN